MGNIPQSGGCPTDATCVNTTTGKFTLGQNPMIFTGQGIVEIRSFLLRCRVTYDTTGTRTSCPAPAAARARAVADQTAPVGVWAHIAVRPTAARR